MAAITVPDLNNAKLDVDHIAAIATSPELTATDRLGHEKETIAGLSLRFPESYSNAAAAATSAANAQASAGNAASSASSASASASAANTAKVAAEAARDSVNTSGKVFPDTASGIAGTTNGQTFSVVDASQQFWIVYKNNAGVAQEVSRSYTTAFFDALFAYGYTASRSGWLHAWVDSVGRLLGGIKLDGTWWSKGTNITSGVAKALTDSGNALTLAQGSSTAAAVVLDGPSRSNYLTVFLDSASRILGGFLRNGELEVKGVNVSRTLAGVPDAVCWTIASKDIYATGDSLSEGAGAGGNPYGAQLQALYAAAGDTRTVSVTGYGGQGAASILARWGPVPSLVTLPTGASGFPEIPASGSVNVTVTKAPLAYSDPSQAKSIVGTLAGVPGTLTKAATTGQYSFARTTPGAVVVCDSATVFAPATEAWRFKTFVCWIGTNNMLSNTAADILAFIGQYLSWQVTTQKRRVVIMPAIDCLSGSLATYKSTYDALLALVKEAYPYEYIDLRGLLQRHNDGSANDLADVAAGLPPRSLLHTDRYHLNATGYGFVAAEIKRILDAKGF